MVSIEIDRETARTLRFAAKMAGVSVSELVARLVAESSVTAASNTDHGAADIGIVAVHVDYEGIRTNALFRRTNESVQLVDGPMAGRSFKSPSGAARAVVEHYKPSVDANRNGWVFWTLSRSGQPLQVLRQR